MITYKLNCTSDNEEYSFGISAFSGDKLIKSIFNVTENEGDIVKLIKIINELELDICHLDDIIEDYLTDFTI